MKPHFEEDSTIVSDKKYMHCINGKSEVFDSIAMVDNDEQVEGKILNSS